MKSLIAISLYAIILLSHNCLKAQCTNATLPVLDYSIDTAGTCLFSNLKLYVKSGSLNSDTAWVWYRDSCGGRVVGSGDTLRPGYIAKRQTFYVRGEGGCLSNSPCSKIEGLGDTTKPQPLVNPLPVAKAQCWLELSNQASTPQAYDECYGVNVYANVFSGNLNLYSQGIDSVVWIFVDPVYNSITQKQLLIVNDTIPPVLNSSVPSNIHVQCDTTITIYPQAQDNCKNASPINPGFGTILPTTSSPLTFLTQGIDTILWVFDDGNGNVLNVEQEIEVKDTIGPNLVCPNDTLIYLSASQTSTVVNNINAVATDNCGKTITFQYTLSGASIGTFSGHPSGSTFLLDSTYITYSAVDTVGNISSCTTLVDIRNPSSCVSATKPTLSYMLDTLSPCNLSNLKVFITNGALNDHTNWNWYSDSCGGNLLGSGDTIYPNVPLNKMNFYVRGEGNCLNKAPCSQILVFGQDTTAPIPNVSPLPILSGECSAGIFDTSQVPKATDNCFGTIVGIPFGNTQKYSQGRDTILWRFQDLANNFIEIEQYIVVKDTTSPTMTCPDNQTLNIPHDENFIVINGLNPTVSDNCPSQLDISYIMSGATAGAGQGDPSGSSFNVGTTYIQYFVKDEAGNETSCFSVITVQNLPSGIVRNNTKVDFVIFPNPNNGKFTIQITDYIEKKIALKIFNNVGQLVKELSFVNQQDNSVNLSKLKAGTYLVNLIIDDEIYAVKQLLIQ